MSTKPLNIPSGAEAAAMDTDPVKTEFKDSISWRVTSTRNDCFDAGFWTSSYSTREEALEHARDMDRHTTLEHEVSTSFVRCYEVTAQFMYEDGRLVQRVSETWRLLI